MSPSDQNQWKKAAADAAAALVENGMVVGLGTGSTVGFFLATLARRVAEEGLRIAGIPTSEETAAIARSSQIPLSSFADHSRIDLAVDGADEIENGTLFLIKGHGGALLREKIVAAVSRRMIVIADETKLVEQLGSAHSVPVEVARFGWQATEKNLTKIGGNPSLRIGKDGHPYVTDGGNFIMNCAFGPIADPEEVAGRLDRIVGVIEHGLFLGYATEAIVGGREGVKTYRRTGKSDPQAKKTERRAAE